MRPATPGTPSRVAAASREDAPELDVRVTLPAEPVRVAVDEELVARMIQPLLDNAVRYGRSGSNSSLARERLVASIQVTDDGPGVAADERRRIFEPGARGAAGRARRGAGLGLALARRLVRSAGGEIVAVADGSGGRFVLTLPLAG